MFVPLAILRLFSFIFILSYDTQCLIFETAIVYECNQDGFLPKPDVWILVWVVASIISSLLFIFIVSLNHKPEFLNFKTKMAQESFKKGSCLSFIVLSCLATLYNISSLFWVNKVTMTITAVFLVIWPGLMFTVAWYINYIPRVRWKNTRSNNSLSCYRLLYDNFFFFFYWIALVLYLFEAACNFIIVALDVEYDVNTLIEKQFPYETKQLEGFLALLLGFRTAFHALLLWHFWGKIFHGDNDQFQEPNVKLVEPDKSDENSETDELRSSGSLSVTIDIT